MAYIIYVLLYSLRKVPAVHASVESSNTSTKIFGVEECFCLPVPDVLAYLRRRIKVLSILAVLFSNDNQSGSTAKFYETTIAMVKFYVVL